jgi:hypothetical protein
MGAAATVVIGGCPIDVALPHLTKTTRSNHGEAGKLTR